MPAFTKPSLHCAPQAALDTLEKAREFYGYLPNLLLSMSPAPVLAKGYLELSGLAEQMDLTSRERQLVMLTVSRHHHCGYCIAGHSVKGEQQGLSPALIEAIREEEPVSHPKLAILREFTLKMVASHGGIEQPDLEAFLRAGYSQANALEVIALIGLKVMSNYTNRLVGTDTDDVNMAGCWQPNRPSNG